MLNGGRLEYVGAQKISPRAGLSMGRNGRIVLGSRCMLEEGVLVHAAHGEIKLGTKVFVNRNSTIVSKERIEIGSFTTIGPNVCIYDHDHDTKHWKEYISKPVVIGEKVWIGSNVTILRGVTIGNNAIIGAGTVVTHDIPRGCICRSDSKNVIVELGQSTRSENE